MTTYTITDQDGDEKASHSFTAHNADEMAEHWFDGWIAAHPFSVHPHGLLLLRDGLLMAVSEGLTIRSYRAAPEMMREAVAS